MSWKTGLLKQTENGSGTQMLMISPVKPSWQTFYDLKLSDLKEKVILGFLLEWRRSLDDAMMEII